MPDIKILLFIGFIIYQLIAFFTKQAAKKKEQKPAPAASIEEMIERMSEQPKQEKPQRNKPAPIISSEVEGSSQEIRLSKKYSSYDNYEQTSPLLSKEDEKPFEEFAKTESKNIYLEKMKNPQSFREAFIIGEILKRKYED
ncbi:MAG TPA: hypothetical protein VL947_04485 [Cytophagales bacterium]|nr:hypothetical protein [Cytophagales bacterium]